MPRPRKRKPTIAGLQRELAEANGRVSQFRNKYEQADDRADKERRARQLEEKTHAETRAKARALKQACQDLQFQLNRAVGYIDRVREIEDREDRHKTPQPDDFSPQPATVAMRSRPNAWSDEAFSRIVYGDRARPMHWTEIDV